MAETIGIIAGGGKFPRLVAEGVRNEGVRAVAVGFAGNTEPGFSSHVDDYRELKLGQLNRLLTFFKETGVSRVVMAGTIAKARALDLRPDMRAAKLLFSLKGKGDDALLRAVAAELEKEGMAVVGPHEIVPGLLTPAGVLTKTRPAREHLADIRYAWPVAKEIGRLDIGQTIVVRKQVVSAVEGLEGTDAAVARGCALSGPGATVVKVFKPGQEKRADLPSVGPETVRALIEGKGGCLAVEAGASLFFDRDEALAEADDAGIAVVGVDETFLF